MAYNTDVDGLLSSQGGERERVIADAKFAKFMEQRWLVDWSNFKFGFIRQVFQDQFPWVSSSLITVSHEAMSAFMICVFTRSTEITVWFNLLLAFPSGVVLDIAIQLRCHARWK